MKPNNKLVVGVDSNIETPSADIPGQDINPPGMPTSNVSFSDDINAIEIDEVDISTFENLPDIETVQLTQGPLRPIQGYSPIDDIPFFQEYNSQSGHSTILENKIPKDADQLSISAHIDGVNVFNPMSLPPVRAASVVAPVAPATWSTIDAADLEDLYFGGNGPSISTPGSAKRAAVEQSMNNMRSQIVNAFNRDIPFSALTLAERTLALKKYETELSKIQLFFQSIDTLRGYASYQSKMGTPLGRGWEALFDPQLYTILTAGYNAIKDLPVFDVQVHKRIEKLARPFVACKRVSNPGTCIMQDAYIAEDHLAEGVILIPNGQYANSRCALKQVFPNISAFTIWSIMTADADHAVAFVQECVSRMQSLRTQYEMVITALAQMTSKHALNPPALSEFLPVVMNGFGAMEFGSAEPRMSWAFHERWEYRPKWLEEEAGALGGAVTGYWKLCNLPDTKSRANPSSLIAFRPVGMRHGKQAWKVRELIDIGLFKEQSVSEIASDGAYITRLAATTLTYSSGAYSFAEAVVSDTSLSELLVDAVYGDLYQVGSAYVTGGIVGVTAFSSLIEWFHGLSFYAAGSGIHNVLDVPSRATGANTVSTNPGVDMAVGNALAFVNGLLSSNDNEDTAIGTWFFEQVAAAEDLAFLVAYRLNAAGSRQISLYLERGYRDAGYYTFSLASVDNALAKAYDEMIPYVIYSPRK